MNRTQRLWLLLIAGVIALAGCATFDGQIPIGILPPDTTYLSPGVADGVQDALVIDLSPIEADNLYVQGFRFVVTDQSGTEMFVIENEIPRRPRRRSVEIPTEIRWEGLDAAGNPVPEGLYLYSARAWDRAGNTGTVGPFRVVVDNTPPAVEAATSYLLFSPNDDGSLDTLLIAQRFGTDEDEWIGSIASSTGTVVRTETWNGVPADFTWDGTDDSGRLLADGEYRYEVAATDRAGNTTIRKIEGIRIDTRPTPVRLAINRRSISPNGDGTADTIEIRPGLDVTDGIEGWKLEIRNALGVSRRIFEGTDVPEAIDWDGRTNDGVVVIDGSYRGVLSVTYANGNRPQGASPLFQIDTHAPTAGITLSTPIFSPDGDGRKDVVTVLQSSSSEARWDAAILNVSNEAIRRYGWIGAIESFAWDGMNTSGAIVPDASYTYRLSATDAAGNASSFEIPIRVDTRPVPVSLSLRDSAFSPNEDGLFDTTSIEITAEQRTEIESWRIDLIDQAGQVRKRFHGEVDSRLPSRIVWDGRWDNRRIEVGSYRARIEVIYLKGTLVAVTSSNAVSVDLVGPRVDLYATPKPFSPDGDRNADTMSITIDASDPAGLGAWTATILDPTMQPFRRFAGTGATRPLIWDGLSDTGELVQSASSYTISYSIADAVGNRSTVTDQLPVDILVIREGDQLRIAISSIYFERYTANYRNVPEDVAAANLATLDLLAERLGRFPNYRIAIEGHAVQEYWENPARAAIEEKEELAPLSLARAQAIREALIERGIEAYRMTTRGYGGSRPVVPHSDLVNRWKNRRVEFVLRRN